MSRRVLILHTGGTLGMIGGHPGPFLPGGDPRQALLQRVPELSDIADLKIELLAHQDSCDVTAAQWVSWTERIRQETWADGVVLIHGTDTMAYTASLLSFLLEERPLPVVLTGSQRPLGAVRTDARQNLADAVTLACSHAREVMVCFDSLGLRGNRTLKQSSASMAAFASPNSPPLVNLGVDLRWGSHLLTAGGTPRAASLGDNVRLSWILPDLAAPPAWLPDTPGIHILATLGSGNLPLHTGWTERIRQETAAGVIHLVVSQCLHGGVKLGQYASSEALLENDSIDGGDLTYVAAVAKARVALGQGFSSQEIRHYLRTVVAGERTP